MAFGQHRKVRHAVQAPVRVSSSDEEESCHKMSPFFPRSISAARRKPIFVRPWQKVTLCSPGPGWFGRHLCLGSGPINLVEMVRGHLFGYKERRRWECLSILKSFATM